MSVPSYKRSQSDLLIFREVQSLSIDIIRMLKSESVIPKRYSKLIVPSIIDNLRNLMYGIHIANSINLNNIEERRLEQNKAKQMIQRLFVDLELVLRFDERGLNKIGAIIDRLMTVRKTMDNWIKSDESRWKNLKNINKSVKSSSVDR